MSIEPYWQPLFDLMSDEHHLTLIESEMQDIAAAVDECRRAERCDCEEFIEALGAPHWKIALGSTGEWWMSGELPPLRFCPWCGKPIRKEGGQ